MPSRYSDKAKRLEFAIVQLLEKGSVSPIAVTMMLYWLIETRARNSHAADMGYWAPMSVIQGNVGIHHKHGFLHRS